MQVAVVFALLVGLAGAAACSSFSEADPTDAGDASAVEDAAVPLDAVGAGDAGPVIRWSFDGSGAASTQSADDMFFVSGDVGFVPGVAGQGLHCARTGSAQTPSTGDPFTIGTGNATFVVWVSLDAESETDASTDNYHTFFNRHMNWASSMNPLSNSGYGFGYVHASPSSYLQGAITNGTDSDAGYQAIRGNVTLGEGVFHMVAFVVEQDALTLYADGMVVGRQPAVRTLPIGTGKADGPIKLCSLSSVPLRGTLDELMIFSRALT